MTDEEKKALEIFRGTWVGHSVATALDPLPFPFLKELEKAFELRT